MSAARIRKSQRTPPKSYPAEKARQGEIILRSTWARAVFMAGLFGGLVAAVALAVYFAILG